MGYCDKDVIDSKNAKHLAYLHSVVVDLAKTGNAAIILRELNVKGNGKRAFPDYMRNHPQISCECRRALGRMYRIAIGGQWQLETTNFNTHGTYQLDRFFDGYRNIDPNLREGSLALCESWNAQVREVRTLYGVETESELVTSQVVNFSTQSINPGYKHKHTATKRSCEPKIMCKRWLPGIALRV